MPGMPPTDALAQLHVLSGRTFAAHFLDVMILHHNSAIQMANGAWVCAGKLRLRLFADPLRLAHLRQAERMRAGQVLPSLCGSRPCPWSA